jgi:uncharacterized Fe-S cluster-containing protein
MGVSERSSQDVDDLKRQAYEHFKEYKRWIDVYESLLKMDQGLPEFPFPATTEFQQAENALKNAEMMLGKHLEKVVEFMKEIGGDPLDSGDP